MCRNCKPNNCAKMQQDCCLQQLLMIYTNIYNNCQNTDCISNFPNPEMIQLQINLNDCCDSCCRCSLLAFLQDIIQRLQICCNSTVCSSYCGAKLGLQQAPPSVDNCFA